MTMEELSEKELCRVRLRFVDLIKSFFQTEPDAENLSRWRGTFSALAREQVSPLFDAAVRDIHAMLKARSLADIQREHYELFVNPFGRTPINMMASWYLDGRSFGESLAALRALLAEAGVERAADVSESEDSLVVLLDVLAFLIEEERHGDPGAMRGFQSRLVTGYLTPLAKGVTEAVSGHDEVRFYTACCRLLCGYLDLEKGLIDAA